MGFLTDLSGPMRPRFLILTPACVLLGLGTAMWSGQEVNPLHFILVLIGAVSAHISVNAFNEYFDFKSGLDFKTQKTPFSGGTGTLPQKPVMAVPTLIISWVSFGLTAGIGVYFLVIQGWALLPLGLLGLFLIYAYTPVLTYNRYLCLAAPGLGFGPAMVMGTHFVLTGEYSTTAFLASLIPFFLVSNLLLLNQFPDVEADRGVGRRHFPIDIGRQASSLIYCVFMLSAFMTLGMAVYFGYLPKATLLGFITLLPAVPVCIGTFLYSNNIKKLLPVMAMNVIINIATPILVAVGLFIQ
jgi:1,4-dihydroxy-2-naphthoate polyprenyltransferase